MQLAKWHVWFLNHFTIYLDFSAIFLQIAPSKTLRKGAFLPLRGAILATAATLRHWLRIIDFEWNTSAILILYGLGACRDVIAKY